MGMSGFCSGSFDLFHVGHLEFLQLCKTYCDKLYVMVGTDKEIRNNKGKDRPIISEIDRCEIVGSLKVVDYAFLSLYENTPLLEGLESALLWIKPDKYLVNDDADLLEERRELCQKLDIEFVMMKRVPPILSTLASTTEIIRKIREGI